MKEVKREKFGSRKSFLKEILEQDRVHFLSNIWVVTCRAAVNRDKASRYLVIAECREREEEYKSLLEVLYPNIPFIQVSFEEQKRQVWVLNHRNGKEGIMPLSTFRNRIIKKTSCDFFASTAPGSVKATPMSRFFREKMGKGLALTDLDFYLPDRKTILEEKTFVKNNKGYLGVGQGLSFKELREDIFQGTRLLIIGKSSSELHLADFSEVDDQKRERLENWGEMIPFTTEKISRSQLLALFK